jgi:hypothetical protein
MVNSAVLAEAGFFLSYRRLIVLWSSWFFRMVGIGSNAIAHGTWNGAQLHDFCDLKDRQKSTLS